MSPEILTISPRLVDLRRIDAPEPRFCSMFTTGVDVYCSPPFSILIVETPSLTNRALNLALIPLPPVTLISGADR